MESRANTDETQCGPQACLLSTRKTKFSLQGSFWCQKMQWFWSTALGVKQEIYIGTLCQWSEHVISECRIHAHMAWFRSMLWDSIKNLFCQHGRDWSAFGGQSSHSSPLIVNFRHQKINTCLTVLSANLNTAQCCSVMHVLDYINSTWQIFWVHGLEACLHSIAQPCKCLNTVVPF